MGCMDDAGDHGLVARLPLGDGCVVDMLRHTGLRHYRIKPRGDNTQNAAGNA